MGCIISKEDFCKTMDGIKSVIDYTANLNNFFLNNGTDGSIFQPDCVCEVLNLLHIMFGKGDACEYIEYFVFDINFGRVNYKVDIRDDYGNKIDITTAELLYDYLVANM